MWHLSGLDPLKVAEKLSYWLVMGWWVMHTICWALVEGCRLVKSTQIKVRRIFKQEVAEE